MKTSEFKRWLEEQGATFGKQTGSHQKVYLNGRMAILAIHSSKEIKKGTVSGIKKQLGLK